MTEGQARRILRQAEDLGLRTTGDRPDVSAWQSHTNASWQVTFWCPPLEICSALPDAQARLARGAT